MPFKKNQSDITSSDKGIFPENENFFDFTPWVKRSLWVILIVVSSNFIIKCQEYTDINEQLEKKRRERKMKKEARYALHPSQNMVKHQSLEI